MFCGCRENRVSTLLRKRWRLALISASITDRIGGLEKTLFAMSSSGSMCMITSPTSGNRAFRVSITSSPIRWPSETLIRGSTRICTSASTLSAMRRVLSSCVSLTPSIDRMVFCILAFRTGEAAESMSSSAPSRPIL